MPRYAPLPTVSIDPRNESELAQQAAQVVYEASNQSLNDFSAGNPLAALLEGQAFAQGEFLFWANQLPEKILIEWIGPFLGAMRRLGTPATALIKVELNSSDTGTSIPEGTVFSTNPEITGGQSFEFISYESLFLPAGVTIGEVPVYSKFVGSVYNVPPNSITRISAPGGSINSVTNPQSAVGGSDVETYDEVKERFFTLIRRRNPVSESDWKDFFEDLYGVGTITSVQPNRSSEYSYNYGTDYNQSNGRIAFFVLNADGTELTDEQIRVGQNAINFSVPIENRGHLFPIKLSPVHYELSLSLDPNGKYGKDFKQSALSFRNRLFDCLQPGVIFPPTINPTVSDVDSAFYSSFPESDRFIDPRIVSSSAYNTPNLLGENTPTYTSIYKFETTQELITAGDLVKVNTPNAVYYPALVDFTPYSSQKTDQTIYGNLSLKQIKKLGPGQFLVGDVVYYDGFLDSGQTGLHVVLENITLGTNRDALSAIERGKVSSKKTYKEWIVGESYIFSENGVINPDIVRFDYPDSSFIPASPSSVSPDHRPGALVWLVSKNFTLERPTNDVTGAMASFILGAPVSPKELKVGETYQAGSWLSTPQVGSGPNSTVDPNYHYVDVKKGATVKYAKVLSTFTYTESETKVSQFFDSLAEDGVIKEITLLDANNGLPVYKYKPRFQTGQYLEYKETAFGPSSYYIACQHFTPPSSNISELEESGLVINLAPTPELYQQFSSGLEEGFIGQIGNVVIENEGSGYVNGTYNNVPLEGGDGSGATAQIVVSEGGISFAIIKNRGQNFRVNDHLTIDNIFLGGEGSGISLRVASIKEENPNPLTRPVRMFTFFKGDRTYFRNGSDTQSFTAVTAVTPLYDFSVYYRNGVFVKSEEVETTNFTANEYIPYFHPSYSEHAEDTIIDPVNRSFYRVMRAFTPRDTIVSWKGVESPNSCRFEEYKGNLLRYVTKFSCEQTILPQSGDETSSIKLGTCQITITPGNPAQTTETSQKIVYVWENTSTALESPELSWFSGTSFTLSPPKYGEGTLAL